MAQRRQSLRQRPNGVLWDGTQSVIAVTFRTYDGSRNRNLQSVYSNFQTPGMYYLILEEENYKSVSVKGLEMGALPGIAYEMGALSA